MTALATPLDLTMPNPADLTLLTGALVLAGAIGATLWQVLGHLL